MQKRNRSDQGSETRGGELSHRERLEKAYTYYEKEWNIPFDERRLTRIEFESISNQLHTASPKLIVDAARDWNYFYPGKKKPSCH